MFDLKVGLQKLHSFGFVKGCLAGGAKPNVPFEV
jgi:hypothetical protein